MFFSSKSDSSPSPSDLPTLIDGGQPEQDTQDSPLPDSTSQDNTDGAIVDMDKDVDLASKRTKGRLRVVSPSNQ